MKFKTAVVILMLLLTIPMYGQSPIKTKLKNTLSIDETVTIKLKILD